MGSVLVKSKCGQTIKVEIHRQEKDETGRFVDHFKPVILKHGDEVELQYYDYKNPSKVIIQTMDER